ncbi:MAG: TetR/AcrR family transcriptional regulator [Deltaproteobacteria bacterium]|nr:TetR/AcrR family transcriptional regulator [Deltaproteobacteria bacterium]
MNYEEFKKNHASSSEDIARNIFLENRDSIRIKKEKTAVNNLEKIFNAVFSISYKKGFQAMSMRDLSRETSMSLGSLYAYFTGKEKLLGIIHTQGWAIIKKNLEEISTAHENPRKKLSAVIKAHIFLSELFRPWFYFTFMEARNLKPTEFETVKAMEEYTHKTLVDIFSLGEKQGVFKPGNHELTSSMIKGIQQEWYLKRWKYRKLNVSVDQFADHLIGIVEAFCLVQETERTP